MGTTTATLLLVALSPFVSGPGPEGQADPSPADTLRLGPFSASPLTLDSLGWVPLAFGDGRGSTTYRPSERGGRRCLEAVAEGGGSGLLHPVTLDPDSMPLLRWSWWVEGPVSGGDLNRKEGDDFAARVYVNFRFDPAREGWFSRLKHAIASRRFGGEAPGKALVYVWGNRAPMGTVAPNAYTDQAMVVVVRSGAEAAGRWWTEERNIPADFRNAFGEDPPDIVSVAIMTDADDTGARAAACYGDLLLLKSGRNAP